jgi:drug/metabolite transporter (DMT)-like permease
VLATTYIADGSLVNLLQQMAIPMSMVISKYLLHVKYKLYQYVAAVIVVGGLAIVLVPEFGGTSGSPILFAGLSERLVFSM